MIRHAKVVPLHSSKESAEKAIISEFVTLIRWASRKYSNKLTGRYDYWDFFEDGLLILALCLTKWVVRDSELEDRKGFGKYFKTSLFNRFRQIEIAAHCKKRFGIHTPLELAAKVSCDGGFGDIFFNELVDHVKTFLSEEEKKIFELMVNPPEDLIEEALHEASRKQKQALILGTYDVRTIRITTGCLFTYINKKGWRHFSEHGFLKTIRTIRKVVREAIDSEKILEEKK
jgi:hypothetical protein